MNNYNNNNNKVTMDQDRIKQGNGSMDESRPEMKEEGRKSRERLAVHIEVR